MPAPYYRPGTARKTAKTHTITYEDGSQENVTESDYLKYRAAGKEFRDNNPGASDTSDRSHPKAAAGKLKRAAPGGYRG